MEKPKHLLDAAYDVLLKERIPMSAKQMVSVILAEGSWKTKSLAPDVTLSARLFVDLTQNGSRSRFYKIARGLFGLQELRDEYAKLPSDLVKGKYRNNPDAPLGQIRNRVPRRKFAFGPGFVYIMSNPCFTKPCVKVGCCTASRPALQKELFELSRDTVPTPYKFVTALKFKNAAFAVNAFAGAIRKGSPERVLNAEAGFFAISEIDAVQLLQDIAMDLRNPNEMVRFSGKNASKEFPNDF